MDAAGGQQCPPASFMYYAKAALSAGVPPLWVEDAVQDIQIALWRSPSPDLRLIVIRRSAISAARKYGPRTRSGASRTVGFVPQQQRPELAVDIANLKVPDRIKFMLTRRYKNAGQREWMTYHAREWLRKALS